MPLRLAVPRPPSPGWTGAIYQILHGFDQPYNLFPSLHITLRAILAELYARHTKGRARGATLLWFSLIGFSTLLTYQHHVVDVVGGFMLAAICFCLFREDRAQSSVTPNYRVGGYYAAGALACLGAALAGWPWTGILLWPALSLAIAAAAYWGLGPVIYRKHKGLLPLGTRLLLAPNLIGQWLSWLHYRRQGAVWSQVTPQVWIGARLKNREAREAKRRGVTAVLDLTAEFSETSALLDLNYCNIAVLDLTPLNGSQLRVAAEFIAQQAATGVVYVHCKAGYSRSVAAVGAYLLASGQAVTVEQAVTILRRARPSLVCRPDVFAALGAFLCSIRQILPEPSSSGNAFGFSATWRVRSRAG